jgi:subfamily B ATP-binding cassette protein HlyB/CyaB
MTASTNTALACLVSLMAHHERPVAADRLAHDYAIDAQELDVPMVLRIAREHGLAARAARLTWRKLIRLGEAFPVLATLKNGRSVVVVGLNAAKAAADADQGDPGTGAAGGEPSVVVHDPLADGDG